MKIGAIIFCLALLVTGTALALDFSADMVSSVKGGGSFTGKIFVAKDKVRMDMAGSTTITRMDKDVAWVLMPQQRIYMEQPLDVDKVVVAAEKVPGEIERTSLGSDTIDGRPANKYKIAYTSKGERAEVFQWVDSASGIPVKTVSMDGNWSMEYKNLSTGAQDASLFEIPAGYNKFSIPNMADMARAMQGGTGQD